MLNAGAITIINSHHYVVLNIKYFGVIWCLGGALDSGLILHGTNKWVRLGCSGCPSGPSFSSHCKVFYHNNFFYNHCLGFIYLSSVAWSCSLLSHAPLCFCPDYSGEVKPQLFFALAFLSYSILFLFMCDSFLVSMWLLFPGGFLFVAVLWRINPRIFCFSFFLPKRVALSILLVPIATELWVKLALKHLLKLVL